MFRELLDIFTNAPPLEDAAKELGSMMGEARAMVLDASSMRWGGKATDAARADLTRRDQVLGEHQQNIRRAVALHFSGEESRALSFGLKLMSLVKDVERIGDYAKNLVKIPELCGSPADRAIYNYVEEPSVAELCDIVRHIEDIVRECPDVFGRFDAETARALTTKGQAIGKRCDGVLRQVAGSDYPADVVVNVTLTTRFYKRILGHHLNILSAVYMPLDLIDSFESVDPV